MANGNGLKILAGFLGAAALSLGGMVAGASGKVTRVEVQDMIDRERVTVNDNLVLIRADLKRIEGKMDKFLEAKGGG